jgi:hypothetical protein
LLSGFFDMIHKKTVKTTASEHGAALVFYKNSNPAAFIEKGCFVSNKILSFNEG